MLILILCCNFICSWSKAASVTAHTKTMKPKMTAVSANCTQIQLKNMHAPSTNSCSSDSDATTTTTTSSPSETAMRRLHFKTAKLSRTTQNSITALHQQGQHVPKVKRFERFKSFFFKLYCSYKLDPSVNCTNYFPLFGCK